MTSFGIAEILIVLGLVLVSFDVKQISKALRWIRSLRTKFYRMQSDLRYQFNSLLEEEETKEKETSTQEEVKRWRTWGRTRVAELKEDTKADASENIVKLISDFPIYKKAEYIGAYVSLSDELNTRALISQILKDGKKLLLPYIIEAEMNFAIIEDLEKDTIKGAFDILEPDHSHRVEPDCLPDLFLIPGRCFDQNGARIGRGKGYYDKYLEKQPGKRLGICFDNQIALEPIPQQSHDQKMDYIISDQRIINLEL
ncbi:MAG: 5-formyltetrahydrofolate cyclo-ligase [Fibrobacteria bacterium]|nr:5-formyltetrahydrofolate cyclo-ligase [Fibrobacteria bacterium]